MAEDTRRRETPETRTHWQRAKDDFDEAEGDTFVSERVVECPIDGGPMVKSVARREPQNIRVTLTCQNDSSHNEERYGYYGDEGS